MNNEFGEYISKIIQKYLSKNDCTKTKLAEELNIKYQHIYEMENGRRTPSLKLMNRMVNTFELSDTEKIKLFDLVTYVHKDKKIPADIEQFIIENKEATKLIRDLMSNYKTEEK